MARMDLKKRGFHAARRFDGKLWGCYGSWTLKSEAQQHARELRKDGLAATRILKVPGGYMVYARYKGK